MASKRLRSEVVSDNIDELTPSVVGSLVGSSRTAKLMVAWGIFITV